MLLPQVRPSSSRARLRPPVVRGDPGALPRTCPQRALSEHLMDEWR